MLFMQEHFKSRLYYNTKGAKKIQSGKKYTFSGKNGQSRSINIENQRNLSEL